MFILPTIMITMSFQEAVSLLNATASCSNLSQSFVGLSIDTRTLVPGNAFMALRGTQTDGHDFLDAAKKQGASVAFVAREVASDLPQIIVQDVVQSMAQLSEAWRNRFSLPVIAVTGSNGKTTTKNMIANICIAATNDPTRVLATSKSFNNHLGLPLTLSKLDQTHRYAVIEMGMNHFGELATLTRLTHPTIAIITNAAAAHIEGVGGSLSGVARAKAEIFLGLPQNGVAILNRDDPFFEYWQQKASPHTIVTFGMHPDAMVRATCHQDHAHRFTLHTTIGDIEITLALLGKHNIQNALAASAAALVAGIPLKAIQTGLAQTLAAPGRLMQHHLPKNITIIDDTYNANPYSLQAAIETLAASPNKKILVLGDMHGLGDQATTWHQTIGEKTRSHGIDALFTYGQFSYEATRHFGKDALHFENQADLVNMLKPHLTENTTILVKGSRVMRMENVVQALLQ